MAKEVKEVSIEEVICNPNQPRKHFDKEELLLLAESIKAWGILQPPVVVPSDGKWLIIAGERRYRAAQLAGLTKLPVVVDREAQDHIPELALIENIQRVDLNPMEIAQSLENLVDLHGYTQQELANKIGKRRSTVANYLRLLHLPPSIQEKIRDKKISFGHAKALLSVEDDELKKSLAESLEEKKWTVRDLENFSRKSNPKKRDPHVEDLEEKLTAFFESKVEVSKEGSTGGCLKIHYYDLDSLDAILSKLGIQL